MPSRGYRSSRRRSAKSRYAWTAIQIAAETVLAANQTGAFDLLANVLSTGPARAGLTVVRYLLNLHVAANNLGDLVEYQHGTYMAEMDALEAGAVPEPVVDDVNWYLHDGAFHRTDVDAGPPAKEHRYDIRSARRIKSERHTLVHVMQNTGAGTSLNYALFARLLLKLP